jgi:ubiquinone/menaquinone biosynthesis C-methylase UbiE
MVRITIREERNIVSLARNLLNQVRNPTGWLGRWNLRGMNRRHSKLTDWGLEHVSIGSEDTILDIGCGGGMTIHKLAAAGTKRKVYGVDYSETSVDSSRRTNQLGIKAGHVEILRGSVSHLPFPDQMFDLATAVETHFYWPDLPAEMREVLRILKPGGSLVLIAEAYKGGKFDRRVKRFSDAMQQMGFSYANLSVNDHRDLLSKAGFADVQVIEEYDKGWICGIGKNPSPPAENDAISNS